MKTANIQREITLIEMIENNTNFYSRDVSSIEKNMYQRIN